MSGWCLEGIYGMPKWYVRCLDVSEGQVRTSQVRISKVRSGQLRIGVWRVSGRCLEGVTFFGHKIYLTPNFLRPQIFLATKICWTQHFLGVKASLELTHVKKN